MRGEGRRVGIRLTTDRVGRATGKQHRLADASGDALHRCVLVDGVEGELSLGHVVDLPGSVTMHHRRSTAGCHPDLNREQRVVGLGAGGENGDLV